MSRVFVSANQMSDFIEKSYGEDIEVEGFEGWTIDEIETSTGDFDSEKGAMTDYEIVIYNPEGDRYVAYDGYYTGVTGHVFHGKVEFVKEDEKPTFESWIKSLSIQTLTEDLKQEIIDKYEELG